MILIISTLRSLDTLRPLPGSNWVWPISALIELRTLIRKDIYPVCGAHWGGLVPLRGPTVDAPRFPALWFTHGALNRGIAITAKPN